MIHYTVICHIRNWAFIIDLWQEYSTNSESDFIKKPGPYPSSTKTFSLKDSRSSFSGWKLGVHARDQGSKRKEFCMEENEEGFFASRIVTNAPIEPKIRLELHNTPINRMRLSYSHLNDFWGLNSGSFHKSNSVQSPNFGHFHTC